jgi:hypothetical protein
MEILQMLRALRIAVWCLRLPDGIALVGIVRLLRCDEN